MIPSHLSRFTESFFTLAVAFVAISLAFALVLTIACRDASKHFNGIDSAMDKNVLSAFGTRFYFAIVSVSTTGYGDITAKSLTSRALVMFVLVTVTAGMLSYFPKMVSKYVQ